MLVIDRQLTRLRALGDFALECSPSEPPETAVDRALRLLLSCFDLDRAAEAYKLADEGRCGKVCIVFDN